MELINFALLVQRLQAATALPIAPPAKKDIQAPSATPAAPNNPVTNATNSNEIGVRVKLP